jgi:chemotaxis protein CheD
MTITKKSKLQFDYKTSKKLIKLQPGEYYATNEDIAIVTILGSCVSCCLFDPQKKIGGMNHFILPADDRGVLSNSTRYGAYAMEVLINAILKLGGEKKNLIAKAFGGGRILAAIKNANIGQRNAEFLQQYLKEEGIALDKADLGGNHARKVCFFPVTGQVFVKKLPREEVAEPLFKEEIKYQEKLQTRQDVELF